MYKIRETFKNILTNLPLNLNQFVPSFLRKNPPERSQIIFRDHFDSTKTREEKIKIEKRKRHQAYSALDYSLSLTTYFDFFSFDAFQIAKDAKHFTQLAEKKIVTSDLLLLPFFYTDSKLSEIFENYGLTKEIIQDTISSYYVKSSETSSPQKIESLKNFWKDLISYSPIQINEIVPNPKIKYSLEINRIFEKAACNALTRFKTPVISTEILFITLMEEENSRAARIIKKFFTNETDWFLLRYNLIKRLHNQESIIRNQIVPNQHYFAYLLKTRFSDLEFENLIKNEYLKDAVSAFRNELLSEVMKINIYDLLEEEVYASIKNNKSKNTRTYSSD